MDNLTQLAETPKVAQAVSIAADLTEVGVSYALNFLSAILLLIAGYLLAQFVSRLIRTRLTAMGRFDVTLVPVLAQIGRYFILVFTIILVLAEFGVQTTSMIAVLGAAGLAIGLALQGTLQNVAAGIMLLIIRPFEVGNYIESADCSGTVDEIGLFMTRMHTPQGLFVAVPNNKLWSNTVTNYSKLPTRRIELLVGISYADDIDKAMLVLMKLLEADERVLRDPDPSVVVRDLGESSVDLRIRAWAERGNYWNLRFDLIRAVKYAFDRENITIPYPHRQIIKQPAVRRKSRKKAA